MKTKISIAAMATLFAIGAQAQTVANNIAANNFQSGGQTNNNQNIPRGNILAIKMPQKSLARKLIEDTSVTYYQQFLGPTASGSSNETYNVFQAAGYGNEKNSGRAPIQSFHALNVRHQINGDWGVGGSLAVSNGYSATVTNPNGDKNKPDNQFFNARLYVNTPAWKTKLGTLFSTISYEAPTSVTSRNEDMRYGWVVAESFAFNLPSLKWTAGMMAQAYRMVYVNNTTLQRFPDGTVCQPQFCNPNQNQTMIISGGPYANYRFNDHWMMGSLLALDWDQRGNQTGTTKFNNNLPHRGRVTGTYFPSSKYVSSIGVFSQALLKFRPGTTAFGAEFSLRF
jgi:hypothetical protein